MTELGQQVHYIIITPARDEEQHIENTIYSVVRQTIPPAQWIIVDDGSRDRTGAIVADYARRYNWITPVHRANRGFRQNGSGVMDAFHEGLEHVQAPHWDFLVKLDADLQFEHDYFERCFLEFQNDAHLGIGGGCIYHEERDGLRLEANPMFHVRGATKIYRRACWQDIGGLIRLAGWDTVDEVKANMKGWATRSFPHLKLLHHRHTGSADGAWRNAVKNGRANYIAGYHPLFMLLKCLKRATDRPYLIGSVGLLWGFVGSYLTKAPRVADAALIRYTRQQQLRRLLLQESIWK